MPTAPPMACPTFRCPGRRQAGQSCPVCGKGGRREHQRTSDARRGSARERGYTTAWDKAAKAFLAEHPLCAGPYSLCEAEGRVVAAECVDHTVPHRGDEQLFWDRSNWAGLCRHCHNVKTGKGL